MDNLVTIITPAYNVAPYIEATILSVLEQDFSNWQMMIVDDGSSDDTYVRAIKIADRDPRIKVTRQANAGPAMARQRALDDAQGRYVAFLDSDDLWLPDKLSKQLSFMSANRAALSFTAYRRISADGKKVGRLKTVPTKVDYDQLLKNTAITTSSVIIDRSMAGLFKIQKSYYDDFVLWLEILKRGHVAFGLQEDLLRYRVLRKSVSRNKLRSAREVWRIYQDKEQLSLAYSAWCFSNYAWNAALKYAKF